MSAAPRTELLAPAGDWACLRAACAAGADAVYFGLTEFSARARAANFAPAELPAVMDYLRARNVRGYVAFNTLVFSEELERAAKLLGAAAESGADATIVQDLGVARLARRLCPTLPLHASTQMTLAEPRGLELACRLAGVARVILPRELSLEQIAGIAAATSVPLEVFVHGALCVSYGGQCLASLALGGRSANRGQCAQPCRLPYGLSGPAAAGRTWPLSPADLGAWELVPDLVRLGVRGLKIEGRLKSAYYVSAATEVYRAALDAALAGRPFALSRRERAALELSFSRGFSRGFLGGAGPGELVPGHAGRSRGVRVGVVAGTGARSVLVKLEAELKPGDGVVFDAPGGEGELQGGRVYAVRPWKGGVAALTFGRGDLDPAAVPQGSIVRKTDDPRLRAGTASAAGRGRPARPAPLDFAVSVSSSGLEVIARDDADQEARAAWPGPPERAAGKALSIALLREQLGRLGGTPFALGAVTLTADAPVTVSRSVLNNLRRQAVARLLDLRAASARRAIAEPRALDLLRAEAASAALLFPASPPPPALTVLVRSLEQIPAALARRPEAVYCDLAEPEMLPEAVRAVRAAGLSAGLATPRVIEPGDEGILEVIAAAKPDIVLARNLAAVAFFRDRPAPPEIVGDFSLNAANELAAAALMELKLARVTPAPDLDWERLRPMLRRFDPARVEVLLRWRPPMFHTKHRLAAAGGGAPRLRDRLGVEHPVLRDALGRSTVFHGEARSAARNLPAMRAAGLRRFRVELLTETAAQAAEILDQAAALLAGQPSGNGGV